jgi:RimJ/RimL family protein N-acetyltransferase
MMIIRTICEDDAEQFLNLCKQLDLETQFMLLEPGERKTTLEEQRTQIDILLRQENQTIFVAEQENRLVGYLAASGGTFKRNRHSAYLVIGILQTFTGQGVGTQLFQRLEEWTQQKDIHRLELTVMTHNTTGIALYKKQGLTIEGTKRHSLLINGQYVDEFYMAKLLDQPASST